MNNSQAKWRVLLRVGYVLRIYTFIPTNGYEPTHYQCKYGIVAAEMSDKLSDPKNGSHINNLWQSLKHI